MKKVLALLLVVATIFCIAACDNGNKDNNPTTTTTTQNSTTTTTTENSTTTTTTEPDSTTTTTEPDSTTSTSKKQEETTPAPAPAPQPINGVDYNNSDNWDKVVNDVYTSQKGGLQMKVPGWKTYSLSNLISFVPEAYNNTGATNAVCIQVYDADPADVFAAKTKADFETVLQTNLDSFVSTKVCGYPAYKAVATDMYFVWVVNTPTHKYFINFMQAPLDNGGFLFADDAAAMMATVVINK